MPRPVNGRHDAFRHCDAQIRDAVSRGRLMRIGLGIGICFPVFGRFSPPSHSCRRHCAPPRRPIGMRAATSSTPPLTRRGSAMTRRMSGGQGILIEPARTNLLTNSERRREHLRPARDDDRSVAECAGRFALACRWRRRRRRGTASSKNATHTAGQSYVWTAWVLRRHERQRYPS